MTELELIGAAYLLAFAVGIVVSGFVSSIWTMCSNEPLELAMLSESDFLTPLRVIVVVLCAPTMLFTGGFLWTLERSFLAVGYFALGAFWSFFQGVFVLTQVFNVT
jgi:hypothetical protein